MPGGTGLLVGLRRGKERDQLGKKGPQVQGRAWGALEAWQGQPFGEEVGFSSKKKKILLLHPAQLWGRACVRE